MPGTPSPSTAPALGTQTAASPGEVVAMIEALVARVLADAADTHLTDLLDQARANGRTDGLSLLIGRAVHAMH